MDMLSRSKCTRWISFELCKKKSSVLGSNVKMELASKSNTSETLGSVSSSTLNIVILGFSCWLSSTK